MMFKYCLAWKDMGVRITGISTPVGGAVYLSCKTKAGSRGIGNSYYNRAVEYILWQLGVSSEFAQRNAGKRHLYNCKGRGGGTFYCYRR